MKKGQSLDWPFVKLARPAGFDPPTPWFVARYSIQLSYGRAEPRIIAETAPAAPAGARGRYLAEATSTGRIESPMKRVHT